MQHHNFPGLFLAYQLDKTELLQYKWHVRVLPKKVPEKIPEIL
jgi:hypothetical protein